MRIDSAGFPEVAFTSGSGECTFCRRCADACPAPAFGMDVPAPWHQTVRIDDVCLAAQGAHCQSCGDACGIGAITFVPRIGGPPVPRLDHAGCTGCGACLSPCPVGAITMQREEPSRASAL